MSDKKKLTQEEFDRMVQEAAYAADCAACSAFEAEFDEVRRIAQEQGLVMNLELMETRIWAEADATYGWRSSSC